MYLNTPCRNYGEVREAIEARSLVVRVVKNRSGELCGQVENGRVGIAMGFALQMILPGGLRCGVCSLRQELGGAVRRRSVRPPPVCFALKRLCFRGYDPCRLFGLAGGWSPVLVALLLPGVFTARGNQPGGFLSSWD